MYTISEQLKKLGFSALDEFTPLIRYFGDGEKGDSFDEYWTYTIIGVYTVGNSHIVLMEEQEWCCVLDVRTSMRIVIISSGRITKNELVGKSDQFNAR